MSSTSSKVNLESLTTKLDERCQLWQSQLRSTASIDRNAVELAIGQLYELVGKSAPTLVWCESPWQAIAMTSVLEKQMTRSAIKKWNDHPEILRTSANKFDDLWLRLWRQLDAQLDVERQRTLILPDEHTLKAADEAWKGSWMGKIPFTSNPNPKPKTIWGTYTVVRNAWKTLGKEMRAPCAVRFGDDPKYAALEEQFRKKMGARTEESVSRQMQADINGFSSAGFNTGIIERFNNLDFGALGLETLKGNFGQEFDKLCTPAERKAMEFMFSLLAGTIFSLNAENFNSSLGMIPFYDFLCDELPDLPIGPSNRKKAKVFLNLVRQTPHVVLLDRVAFVSERPLVMEVDDNSRLHSADGPAIAFPDGFKLYSWHGTTVPQKVIDSPLFITVDEIIKEWNAEIRRVKIEIYGLTRFIQDCGATEVSRDECGVLYRKEFTNDEALVMVKVINSTPEPDGTYKTYFLRVPPAMKTAREAVAWTFDMSPEGYAPSRQT